MDVDRLQVVLLGLGPGAELGAIGFQHPARAAPGVCVLALASSAARPGAATRRSGRGVAPDRRGPEPRQHRHLGPNLFLLRVAHGVAVAGRRGPRCGHRHPRPAGFGLRDPRLSRSPREARLPRRDRPLAEQQRFAQQPAISADALDLGDGRWTAHAADREQKPLRSRGVSLRNPVRYCCTPGVRPLWTCRPRQGWSRPGGRHVDWRAQRPTARSSALGTETDRTVSAL